MDRASNLVGDKPAHLAVERLSWGPSPRKAIARHLDFTVEPGELPVGSAPIAPARTV